MKLKGQHNSAPAGVARPHHRGGDAMGSKEAALLFSDETAGRSKNLDTRGETTALRDATAYVDRSCTTKIGIGGATTRLRRDLRNGTGGDYVMLGMDYPGLPSQGMCLSHDWDAQTTSLNCRVQRGDNRTTRT